MKPFEMYKDIDYRNLTRVIRNLEEFFEKFEIALDLECKIVSTPMLEYRCVYGYVEGDALRFFSCIRDNCDEDKLLEFLDELADECEATDGDVDFDERFGAFVKNYLSENSDYYMHF